jgi:hypothetical protein
MNNCVEEAYEKRRGGEVIDNALRLPGISPV